MSAASTWRRARLAGNAWLVLSVLSDFALAAEPGDNWQIVAPQKSETAPGAPLVVSIAGRLSPAQIASVAVELDHIDVTAVVQISESEIRYRPAQTLEIGPHELHVVEYDNTGRANPRGTWAFTVRSAAAADASSWARKGTATLSASDRVAQPGISQPAPPRSQLGGTVHFTAVRPSAEWTAEADVSGFFGSNSSVSTTGHAVQPGQVQFSYKNGKNGMVLGDQTIAVDNLLVSGLTRRGLSLQAAVTPLRTDVLGFALRETPAAGISGGIGLNPSIDTISGTVVQVHPLADAKTLNLFAGLVGGSAPAGQSVIQPYPGSNGMPPNPTPVLPGAGTLTPVQAGTGSAWLTGVNAQLPGARLKLDAEYAGSSFNYPGASGQGTTNASDHAYRIGVDYGMALPANWTLGANANHQNVGTYFTSLANPALPMDQRTSKLGLNIGGHGLQLSGTAGLTRDNTDDNAAIATVHMIPRSLSANYGLGALDKDWAWLGSPSLSLQWQDARTFDATLPAGSVATQNSSMNGTAGLNFAYAHWSWTAGASLGRFHDATGQQDDTNSLGPNLGAQVGLGGGAMVGANVQILRTRDQTQGSDSIDRNVSLTASENFLHNRIGTQLSITVNHNLQQQLPGFINTVNTTTQGASAVSLKTATLQITWHALAAQADAGGLDLSLSGTWNDSQGLNTAILNNQGYTSLSNVGSQVFLTVSSTWPLGNRNR